MNRHERRAAAREAKKAPSGSGASNSARLCEFGRQHLQAGRLLDAQLCCRQALAADPDFAEALHLMGLVSLQGGQFDHAIEWIARADRQAPGADYLLTLALALEQQGRFAEALKSYQRLIEREPHHLEAAHRCGFLLLSRLGRAADALAYLDLCDRLHPNHASVLDHRSQALLELRRPAEALTDGLAAHALNPANADICNNIGVALQLLQREDEALAWFDKAVALRQGFAKAVANKAFTLTQIQRFDEALAAFGQAKAIDPSDAGAELNCAQLHLLTGNFEAGWAGREARWRSHAGLVSYPKFSQPVWRGNVDASGKTILVYEDEGFGDTIQFARYVPMLAARGARVILVVGDALHPLLSRLPGVARCLPKSSKVLPAFDMHCPACSLPLAFATRLDTIPAAMSYLPAPATGHIQAWEARLSDRLGPHDRLRVGLVWSGRPTHMNDHNRSIPLEMLSRLLDPGAAFVSLQKDPRPIDRTVLADGRLVDLTGHLADFADTAALASCLDLVITVDTSVAHLAGALGRPAWVMLPYTPDWRWLLGRDDSPWYPTLRLFRQGASRNWEDVLERVWTELAARVAAFRAAQT